MKTLNDVVKDTDLLTLTSPSDIRLGREILTRGKVEIIESDPFRVLAKVQPRGGLKRTVELTSTDDGLQCRCT